MPTKNKSQASKTKAQAISKETEVVRPKNIIKANEVHMNNETKNNELDNNIESKLLVYDAYRKIVSHEDNLINWRVTWFLIFQGVLITSFTQVGFNDDIQSDLLPSIRFGLQTIGFMHCIISFFGILSAAFAIRTIRAHYEANYNFDNLPPLTGGGYRNATTNLGVLYHLFLPFLFLFIWIFLFTF